MLFKIAWRNVWRQKSRSLVIMLAIIVGLWGLIFTIGFMSGFLDSYLDSAIRHEYSHIQIHNEAFKQDQEIKYKIDEPLDKVKEISALENVKAVSYRTVANGMISSSKASGGVRVLAVDTLRERQVTSFDRLLEEGSYFSSIKRNPVLIGNKLAEKLKVKLRSKIVVTFQNQENEIVSGAFRVAGIFKGKSPQLSQMTILVQFNDLKRMLDNELVVNEVAILLEDESKIDQTMSDLKEIAPGYLSEKWDEIAPEVALIVEQSNVNMYVLVIIFMTALIFGIINTMLMAVLERIKELGMLMAIGMNRWRVFSMIVTETIYLGLVAAPIGLFLGYLTLQYLSGAGIDLSAYSEGLEDFGYESIIYPSINYDHFMILTIGIVITTILASIYPAIKAVRLKPVEALRSV